MAVKGQKARVRRVGGRSQRESGGGSEPKEPEHKGNQKATDVETNRRRCGWRVAEVVESRANNGLVRRATPVPLRYGTCCSAS